MNRITLIITALMLASLPPSMLHAQDVEEFTVVGIDVVHRPIEANDVIAVQLYVKGGSAALTPETAGVERFIGAVATRGTEKYDKDAFASRAAATGAAIGGQAFHDYSVMTLQAVTDYWDESWDLFSQAVLHPTFPENEVELVREQIINALKGREDNPDQYLALLANDLLYAGHPYAVDPNGTVEAIESLTATDLAAWHARRLTKENLLFVVVGNVDRADLETKITAAFGALPTAGGTAAETIGAEPGGPDVNVVERELPTNYIRGQFVTPPPGDPDYAPLRVGLNILSNRLFEEVRTKRNLTYAVFSGLSQRRANYGLLYVTAVEPDTTLKVMYHEVERLKTEPITEERLQESVNVFVTRYWMGQETNMGLASALGTFELAGGGWEQALEFIDRVHDVTPADIQRVAAEYLKDLHFAVLGDPEKIDEELFTSL